MVRFLKVPLYYTPPASTAPPPRDMTRIPLPTESKEEEGPSTATPSIFITWIWIQVISYSNHVFWFHITEGAPPPYASMGPCAMATPPPSSLPSNRGSGAERIGVSTTLLSGGPEGGGLGESLGSSELSTGCGLERSGGAAGMRMEMFAGCSRSSGAWGGEVKYPQHAFCEGLARRLVHRVSKDVNRVSEIESPEGKWNASSDVQTSFSKKALGEALLPHPMPDKKDQGEKRREVMVIVNISISPEKRLLLLSTEVGSGFQTSVAFGKLVYKECLRCIQDPSYGLVTAKA